MTCARFVFAAALVGASLTAGTTFAQSVPVPDLKPILGGRKFTAPVRGEARIDFVAAPQKREGTTVVTKFQVKNVMPAPIVRLKISETWYDKAGNTVTAGEGVLDGMLQPGALATIEVRTPIDPKMTQSKLQFTHANGQVAPSRVAKVEEGDAPSTPVGAPKAAPAKAAPAKAAPAKAPAKKK